MELASQRGAAKLRGARVSQARSDAALVLLDSWFRALSFSPEAMRILAYPREPKEIQPLVEHMETHLRPLVETLRASRELAPALAYQSGRRHYSVRIFSLTNHRKASVPPNDGVVPARALLFERRDREFSDLWAGTAQFHITPREREVLGLVLEGLTSKEIAVRMNISRHTVNAFIRLVMGKMQVSTRSGIIGKIIRVSQ